MKVVVWWQIQLLEPSCHDCDSEEQSVVLRNSDWQFCKLVEHLDHVFLHGYVLFHLLKCFSVARFTNIIIRLS